ncbi:hypothetical protein [Aquimarina aggregata]|uniref:hypothetical protein n=1 Tax=Aquimarina aggregata TaxID=1642818 RepID=UPI00248F5F86|nr:hypothetical protein [Aquimarina aggregata]
MKQNQEQPKYHTTLKNTKGFDWKAKTIVKDILGYDWNITTLKMSSGKISCTAQAGTLKDNDGYESFSFILFQDPLIRLYDEKRRATEKAVEEVHDKGLAKFTELLQSGKITSRDEK